ncbi:MAG TPA: DUF6515 family protein [Methyloversatilis sp.]
MQTRRVRTGFIAGMLYAATLVGSTGAFADRAGPDGPDRRPAPDARVPRPVPIHPGRGVIVPRLPREAHVVPHNDRNYYFSRGTWYRPLGHRFMVVTPPVGAFISVLPYGYLTFEIGGHPYYRYNDIYYERLGNGFVVIDPPEGVESAPPAPTSPDNLFIYPKMKQSAEQQATDRFECHEWASGQTGYDPTRVSGGVPPSQAESSRAAYLRAMSACLEARGYTVR